MDAVRGPLPRVAVCGLGAMGGAMANVLLSKGFDVSGFDVFAPARETFAKAGGQMAATPREAAAKADILLIMVTNDAQVTTVLLNPTDGAVNSLRKDAVVIISSTVPFRFYGELSRKIFDQGREDLQILDCPVSGGAKGARAGTLTIFSSGSSKGLEVASPVLQALGTKIYQIPGGLGFGSKGKMCHQVLPEVDIALCAEAMALAARAGLNTREVFDAVQQGGSEAWSWIVGDRVIHALEGDKRIYSAVPNSTKDSSIIVQTATSLGCPVFLVATALQVYLAGEHAGWAKDDDSTLWRLYLHGHGEDVIHEQTKTSRPIPQNPAIEISDVVDIFAAVHLATAAEMMQLVRVVGLDEDTMYNIVAGAAGANAQFAKYVPEMKQAGYALKAASNAKDLCARLAYALAKANSIGASLPVASAALQVYYFQLGTP